MMSKCDDDFDYTAGDDFNWDDYDWCYECTGYGDDYFINDEGELESACPTCPHNRVGSYADWDDEDD
jgi:hypothetical protein